MVAPLEAMQAKELELKRKKEEELRLERLRKEEEARLEKERLQREAEERKRQILACMLQPLLGDSAEDSVRTDVGTKGTMSCAYALRTRALRQELEALAEERRKREAEARKKAKHVS